MVNPEPTPSQGDFLELFTFSVGRGRYAVDLARVDEVLPEMEKAESPGDGVGPVCGVVTFRGQRLPVVDLRACLAEGPAVKGGRPGLLVCWLGRRRVAFCIDGVGAVAQVAVANLRLPAAAEAVPPGVTAVWTEPAGTCLLLDVLWLLHRKSLLAPQQG